MNLDTLQTAVQAGQSFKYLFFWGHTPKQETVTDKSCFSQWFPSPFEVDGVVYPTAEHFMMAGKARLFHDKEILPKILNASHPNEAKKLGRLVANFDGPTWEQHRFEIVVKGNLAKFAQNEPLRKFLLNTGDRILVEASPYDRIWGIGLAADDVKAQDPLQWRGLNLLGFALMAVRSNLAN
ncbi:MAG: NADAR family protein [Anaerolineales bacterium]|nr:NADAR family protein [Anaerolineales bacterium]